MTSGLYVSFVGASSPLSVAVGKSDYLRKALTDRGLAKHPPDRRQAGLASGRRVDGGVGGVWAAAGEGLGEVSCGAFPSCNWKSLQTARTV